MIKSSNRDCRMAAELNFFHRRQRLYAILSELKVFWEMSVESMPQVSDDASVEADRSSLPSSTRTKKAAQGLS